VPFQDEKFSYTKALGNILGPLTNVKII